eukprot:GHVU01023163.1.p3 GENE.GHVU01023163.1~~GHVU01023163.1.p3  ORF type:complete len:132 (-),score=2.53 GHVU01023163.1:242-637(-)
MKTKKRGNKCSIIVLLRNDRIPHSKYFSRRVAFPAHRTTTSTKALSARFLFDTIPASDGPKTLTTALENPNENRHEPSAFPATPNWHFMGRISLRCLPSTLRQHRCLGGPGTAHVSPPFFASTAQQLIFLH